jgi:uncharacterized coiled-coil protein SlyX
MDRAAVERSLLLTEERLAECEQRIAIQREVIVELKAGHGDTTEATLLLEALHDVRRAYVTIKDRLRAELDNSC